MKAVGSYRKINADGFVSYKGLPLSTPYKYDLMLGFRTGRGTTAWYYFGSEDNFGKFAEIVEIVLEKNESFRIVETSTCEILPEEIAEIFK
jgi:hypothetical protein